jgi:hypothetical protein
MSLPTNSIASIIKVNQLRTLMTGYPSVLEIQGDSGEKVSILGGESISYGQKRLHMNMCLILNKHRDKVVYVFGSNTVRFLFEVLNEGR